MDKYSSMSQKKMGSRTASAKKFFYSVWYDQRIPRNSFITSGFLFFQFSTIPHKKLHYVLFWFSFFDLLLRHATVDIPSNLGSRPWARFCASYRGGRGRADDEIFVVDFNGDGDEEGDRARRVIAQVQAL